MKWMLYATVISIVIAWAEIAVAQETKPAKWDVSHPPGPGRDVTIDVTSGTWMAVDVSPDGKEIAFDLLGDIYVIPITGGEARALTTGMAWDMQPRYSPNGKWIAFTSDRGGGDNLWVMDRDGSNPREVSRETFRLLNSPAWTPDSEFIVGRKHFTSRRSLGAGEMWLYHRAGGDGVELTERRTQEKDSGEPALSPDGRYLYFSDDATPGGTFEYSKDPNTQIYVIQRLDRETGDVSPFVAGPGGAIRPTPSPDGKSLAFIRRDRYQSKLYVLDIESGRETPVYEHLDRDMQETWAIHGVYPGIAWTPDNKALIFWAGGKINRLDVTTKTTSVIPFHVAGTRRVADAVRFQVEVAPDQFEVKMTRWASASPDGRKAVFEALGHLWIKDLPDGAPRRLTKQSDHFELFPSWSRDSHFIVYTTWSDKDLGSIRVIPATGGEGRKITRNPGDYVEPVFAPDGQTIVYRSIRDGYLLSPLYARETGLYAISAAGGEPRLISRKGSQPQFGARSDRVFFRTVDGDKRTLRSVSLNGGEEHTHLTSQWATQFSVSPDEKWLAWTERFNAYVAPFVASSKTLQMGPKGSSLPQARVTRDGGEGLHWSGDSRRLNWSLGAELFSRDIKDSFTFVEGAPPVLPEAPGAGIKLGFRQPYDKPTGRVALAGGRLITMRGDEVIDDGVVILNGNRIEAIGPRNIVNVPAGTKVINIAGKTVIPGLIDAHRHGALGADGIIPQQSWVDYATLAYGVTTVHDPSNDTSELFAHSELAKAGLVVSPRIFGTGAPLYGAASEGMAQIDSLDDALAHLRRLKAAGAWSVKSYNQPRRDQRQQIIEAARELGMLVVPEGGSLYDLDMGMIVDGHTTIEHAPPVARMYEDVIQLWSSSKTAWTPTLIVAFGGAFGENWWYQATDVWKEPILAKYVPRRIIDARSRRAPKLPDEEANHINVARESKQLNDLGVPVSIGAHGQREGLGAHWELWSFVQGGMSNHQALKAGTINPAKALGMEKDLGSLEMGKLGDLVVLNNNPLENIRNTTSILFVIANGRVYDANMDEVGTRMRKRKPFWFAEDDGEGGNPSGFDDATHADVD